jgi:dihydroxyacid dehydratase/phosphogluconate dehydratase
MDTHGMCYSLQSHDLITNCIVTVMGAQHYDTSIFYPDATRT